MRLVSYADEGGIGLAARRGDDLIDVTVAAEDIPADLHLILADGLLGKLDAAIDSAGRDALLDPNVIDILPPIEFPGKILCIGLNYIDHAAEGDFERPDYPVVFTRMATTLVGHEHPLVRPEASFQLDYEGELAAIIGQECRHVPRSKAHSVIAGYSVFNDATVRDYQFKTSQWTMGKNFDATGGFGPEFVSADELPPGGKGLSVVTRLNGETLQDGNTNDFIFPLDELIEVITQAMTLEPGDVIITGTPAGVGAFREPPIWMKPGDICEVEIEGVGLLRNPVADEDHGDEDSNDSV